MKSSSRGRARFGLLVPFTNTNLEPDFAMMCPSGVSLHAARLGGYDIDAVPDEKQMAGLGASPLDEPLRLIAGVRPDVVFYGCTSATLTHGVEFDQGLSGRIHADTGAATVTAAGALVHALDRLNVERIAFASPYVGAINRMAVDFLANAGFKTVNVAEVNDELDNYGQGELSPERVFELGSAADDPKAEAVVLSCTDMRSAETVARLETALDKPVICSNQAMLFQGMEALGMDLTEIDYGRLFHL